VDVHLVRVVDHLLDEGGRDEVDALGVAEDEVPGHHRGLADAHGDVDTGDDHVADRSRVHTADVRGHRHLRDAFQVADGPIHHQPPVLRGLHDVVEQVVPDDRPALFQAEQIHHEHVPRLQHVDGGLVDHAAEPRRLGMVLHHRVEVRTRRHELERERAAGQLQVRVEDSEVARPLIAEALLGQHGPDFLRGESAGPLDERVRDLGPAVGEPLERVLRRELDHLVPGQREELGLARQGRQRHPEARPHREDRWVLHPVVLLTEILSLPCAKVRAITNAIR
jgi:hypothetical protein